MTLEERVIALEVVNEQLVLANKKLTGEVGQAPEVVREGPSQHRGGATETENRRKAGDDAQIRGRPEPSEQRGGLKQMTRIQIVGLLERASEFDGQYLVEYDPTRPGVSPQGHQMDAHIVTTSDINRARQFSSLEDAFECWRQSHGRRADGKPNRPLTAFTVTFV